MKKRLAPPPEVEVQGTTMKDFPKDKLLEEVKAIYSKAKDVVGEDGDKSYLKQRIVEAALKLLDEDKHVVLMVGEDIHASFSDSKRMKREVDDTQPTNYKAENYATRVEWIDFKVF